MIEQLMWFDPQTEKGHYCAVCLREMFGEEEICRECLDREDLEWEVCYE